MDTDENKKEGPPPVPKPVTFDEAFKDMLMSDEEAAELEAKTYQAADAIDRKASAAAQAAAEKLAESVLGTGKAETSSLEAKADDPPGPEKIPEWVTFPAGFKIPPHKQIAFMRFRAAWTDRSQKGDRWCLLWPLSDAEEKLALKRTRGESSRSLAELSKQQIRIIDGDRADWTGDPKEGAISVERFWDEIGGKCRQLVINFYLKTNSLDAKEQQDFFLHCLHVRTSAAG